MSLRLYLDHHVDRRITDGLRQRGYDVLTAREDGYDRRSDADLLARASELGRVVFTFNDDFLSIAAAWQSTGRRFAGVIFGRSRELPIGGAVLRMVIVRC